MTRSSRKAIVRTDPSGSATHAPCSRCTTRATHAPCSAFSWVIRRQRNVEFGRNTHFRNLRRHRRDVDLHHADVIRHRRKIDDATITRRRLNTFIPITTVVVAVAIGHAKRSFESAPTHVIRRSTRRIELRQKRYANTVPFRTFVRFAIEQRAVPTRLRVVAKAIPLLRTIKRCRALTSNLRCAAVKKNKSRKRGEGEPSDVEWLHCSFGVLPAGGPTCNHAATSE